MGSMQRADRYEQLFKALKKHYKPVATVSDRKVLDHMMYACCLQDASYEAADEAFAKLQQAYFDSNEIRVTTIAELSESLTSLRHAAAAANRIKKTLQSMFENRYSFDIDDLKKSNLGKAVDEVSGWQGVSKFVASYVTQHAFGGHSIPVDESTLTVCQLLNLLNPVEAEKRTLPGIERAIAKNKGLEFGSLLHQFAVEHATNYKNTSVVAVFKELGMTSKPKAPPPPPAPVKPIKIAASTKQADSKTPAKGTKTKTSAPIAVSAAQSARTAALDALSSKTKNRDTTSQVKSSVAKPSKEVGSAKTGRPTKTAPPSTAKPSGKSAAVASKSPVAKKTAEAKIDRKSKIKPTAKPKPKSSGKPAVKKPESKKVDAKKPVTKKGGVGAPAKPATKRAADAKPSPKKLPVKPVTKKRTKPR